MLTYAEIHYQPRFVPSFLFRKRPEIICDAPYRVDPYKPVPLFLIVKDADRYPVRIESVVVRVVYPDGNEKAARFPYGVDITEHVWWDALNIMPECSGDVVIDPYVVISRGGKMEHVHVDNYAGTSHYPLTVHVSETSLPGGKGWFHGDPHCHTFFTEDQVEFGAPVELLTLAGHCAGLSWIGVADHSYDLDDMPGSWRTPDPELHKWSLMRNTAAMLSNTFAVIPGEEVTCTGTDGRNVHLLCLNGGRFIPGSGDGGESGPGRKSERTVPEAVAECVEWGGAACAAHPCEHVPLMERLFLRRGGWHADDLGTPGLGGLQFFSASRNRGFARGKQKWINLLLAGRKIAAWAGNDSHGDLNRRRAIALPLLSITEKQYPVFGRIRTVVRADSDARDDIFEALKNGRSVVTDGPFIELLVEHDAGWYYAGDTVYVNSQKVTVVVNVSSTGEFGPVDELRIICGEKGGETAEPRERELLSRRKVRSLEMRESLELMSGKAMYVRAECATTRGKICLTNPVWIV